MGNFKKVSYYALFVIGSLLIAASALSLFYNISSTWWIKSLNFPRLQFLLAGLFCLLLLVIVKKKRATADWIVMAGLSLTIILNASYVVPYTAIAGAEVPSADNGEGLTSKKISLLIANVYMKNRKAETLAAIIKEQHPDIVFLMETNQWWQQQMQPVGNSYPYSILYPLDNTYGFLLYSRYPISDSAIRFLKNPGVPSLHIQLKLTNRQSIMFHGIHPVPPVPSQYPDNVGEKAGELEEVAAIVAKETLPVIVAGDLNDVAWSKTSRLFNEHSRLKDVRTGRGLYNSFDATSLLFRWPLDHVFVSDEFRFVDIKRLKKFGSDHFPIYVELALPASPDE